MDELKYLEKPSFDLEGNNDIDGVQIFTPEFIVNKMLFAIGLENITDFSKNILEPTSGDGAFTCRILLSRLSVIKKDYASESLKALSTIYSIEMDKKLMEKQRNNIYTIMFNFAKEKEILSEQYLTLLKDIIFTNFYWAKTNVEQANDGFFIEVAYKMPGALKNKNVPIDFYVWKINDDLTYKKSVEEVNVW